MDDDFASGWGERSLIEVEHAMDLGVGRDLDIIIRDGLTEKIECCVKTAGVVK